MIGEALFARAHPAHQLSEPSRQYAYMTTLDIARDCLRTRGLSFTGLSPAKVVERALHTTSDFPLILGDAVGRTLRMGYQAAPSGLKRVGRKTTARDFRDKRRLALSEGQRLEKVNEAGEFKSGTFVEAQEMYRLLTYGKVFGISRQALVNDDLGAFTDLSRRLGQTAAATESALLVELLTDGGGLGPAMSDGKKFFHTGHGNLSSVGSAPNVEFLSKARTALRKQTGLQGENISVTPKFFVVPAELETDAEKLLAQITATKADDINPFAGALQLVVEPRFTDALRWYVVADPAEIDGLEYAYLEGEEGPQIETKAGFEVDGVQIRVRLDFGAGLVDWRSWYSNPGNAGE
ncbi:Mu-like prophage major head subunit gpT family protein [Methyloceanibacter methanicus]|uniref:phage major capsid protein n=1 Tax=Methyloceanibacter methanicus TaxID=1774968 RepID=UPI000AD96013|nr:Mu-like prophage major head subunit gpT family protein [Methyloceanibacter methanicus]